MPSASSSDETTLASMFQSQDATPEENAQLPRNRYPPSTFRARPAGNIKEDAISASGGCPRRDPVRACRTCRDPVMAGKVRKIPGHPRVTLAQQLRAIDKSDVIKFRPPPAFAAQSGTIRGDQILLGLRRQATQLFRPRGTITKLRNQSPSPADHGHIGPIIGIVVRESGQCLAFDQHLPAPTSA